MTAESVVTAESAVDGGEPGNSGMRADGGGHQGPPRAQLPASHFANKANDAAAQAHSSVIPLAVNPVSLRRNMR
jgi:hypothetical protein